jgi:hypothetical protein
MDIFISFGKWRGSQLHKNTSYPLSYVIYLFLYFYVNWLFFVRNCIDSSFVELTQAMDRT